MRSGDCASVRVAPFVRFLPPRASRWVTCPRSSAARRKRLPSSLPRSAARSGRRCHRCCARCPTAWPWPNCRTSRSTPAPSRQAEPALDGPPAPRAGSHDGRPAQGAPASARVAVPARVGGPGRRSPPARRSAQDCRPPRPRRSLRARAGPGPGSAPGSRAPVRPGPRHHQHGAGLAKATEGPGTDDASWGLLHAMLRRPSLPLARLSWAYSQARGLSASLRTSSGSWPETMCSRLTSSRIARSLARSAIQTVCSGSAAPM